MLQCPASIPRNVLVDVRVLNSDGGWVSAFLLPPTYLLSRDRRIGRSYGSRLGLGLDERRQSLGKRLACLRQHHPVLRTLRSGQTRFHRRKVETEEFRVFGFPCFRIVKQSLLARVGLDQSDLLVTTSRECQ